jgi:hypothetical protein
MNGWIFYRVNAAVLNLECLYPQGVREIYVIYHQHKFKGLNKTPTVLKKLLRAKRKY